MSLPAALVAVVAGTLLGTGAVAVVGLIGTQTGAPSMVLLRGIFGLRPSSVPTLLNVLQMLGWGAFELVTIAAAGSQLLPGVPHWLLVLVGGTLSTLLALRPLGSIRMLRRYVTALVVLALAYLAFRLLQAPPADGLEGGSWSGLAAGIDSTLAVAVSWVPMAADYARHSRSERATVVGTVFGYAGAQIGCYTIGLLALLTVSPDATHIFAAFRAFPFGPAVFAVLVLRELDQSYANVYSTTVSVQNLRPHWDRRAVALAVGLVVTVLAGAVDLYGYADFLSLIGAVFVPMFAVLVVDYFGFDGRTRWDLSAGAAPRWPMFLPWAVGFAAYELISPGQVRGWTAVWQHLATWIHLGPPSWMSASLASFAVAGAVTGLVDAFARRRDTAASADPPPARPVVAGPAWRGGAE
jgi:putative hydroxymethylpyrimidine transporter CytX